MNKEQKLEELKKELQNHNKEYKLVIEKEFKKYNQNTLSTTCKTNITKTIEQFEIEDNTKITAHNVYQYESLNYLNNTAYYVQSRYYFVDQKTIKELIQQYESALFRVYKEITSKKLFINDKEE
ncbi:29109_t:CDS:2, partial [Racocetra persica]